MTAVFMLYLLLVTACSNQNKNLSLPEEDPFEAFSGGTTTNFTTSQHAFDLESPGLSIDRSLQFISGNASFNVKWTAPGNSAITGLGPVFNSRSCRGCHVKDGRGKPPQSPEEFMTTMLVRLSLPGKDDITHEPKAHPVYGGQLQDKSISGIQPEGKSSIHYEDMIGYYGDGEPFTLRKPVYSFSWNFGDPGEFRFSPRVAQQVYGLGLLEAISDSTLQNFASKQAMTTNNISGKVNQVFDKQTKTFKIGRFGWKAGQPSLRQQSAGAALGDIGLTNTIFPTTNCTATQVACTNTPDGDNGHPTELGQTRLDMITIYMHLISVPGRRKHKDPIVKQGKKIFNNIGCANCHIPRIQTGQLADFPEVSNQRIYPYTDLLLHNMGEGLADNREEFDADGQEWRTPPLWGTGLIEKINKHNNLLHDGRARGFAEAILWHGGEALQSKNDFLNLSKTERNTIITFLKSL